MTEEQKTKAKEWHYDLTSLCLGLGSTDVYNETYLAKEIFDMRMPNDYEREGTAFVASPTVIRETFLLDKWFDQEESMFGILRWVIERYKNLNLKSYLIGRLLSHFSEDDRRLAAVCLDLKGNKPAMDLNLNADEKEKAESVIARLKEASKGLVNIKPEELKKDLDSSLEEAAGYMDSLKGILRGIESKLQTLSL